MKRFLFFILLCTICLGVTKAQDIIVTHDGERIDAIVIEISDTEVRYKRADNADGPTFVLTTEKIASIVYKNGEVQTFMGQNTQNQPVVSGTQGTKTVYSVRDAADIAFVAGQKIVKSEKRHKYYYGDIELDESLYRDFLKLTCSAAYKEYSTGTGLIWLGYLGNGIITGVGLGLVAGSGLNDALLISGAIITVAGLGSGITLVCIGAKKDNKSLDIFNAQCSQSLNYKQALSLNLGVTSNGIGLTLNF